tara:strand:- start:1585 stop:2457 length:873 start_codon:yes stop_codon:yes gene_type:complete
MKINTPVLGIIFMCCALSLNAVKDGLAKLLDGYYSPLFLVWLHLIFSCLILIPIVWAKYGKSILFPRPILLQIVRSMVFVIGISFFYWSLEYIPLADTTSMVFIAPILVTALSPWLLNEKIDFQRVLAVVFGFAGVLIILRPEFSGERIGYFLALTGAVGIGLFYIANRKLAKSQPQLVAVTYTAIIGTIFLTPLLPYLFKEPRVQDSIILLSFVSLATIGQILMISAFSFAQASVLAPFQYMQLLSAIVFGLLVFDAFPDIFTLTGASMLIAAGLFITFRENKMRVGIN